MKISKGFQGFFFGVVCPQLKEKATSPFKYQHPFTKEWILVDLRKVDEKRIYEFLKYINPYFPKYEGFMPESMTKLDSKQLLRHLQWIERWAAENGVVMQYVQEQYDQMLRDIGIKKE